MPTQYYENGYTFIKNNIFQRIIIMKNPLNIKSWYFKNKIYQIAEMYLIRMILYEIKNNIFITRLDKTNETVNKKLKHYKIRIINTERKLIIINIFSHSLVCTLG